jgi:HAMP domain-containing protein/signal transduction histidine kinase/CheY-like chemotaxis protein
MSDEANSGRTVAKRTTRSSGPFGRSANGTVERGDEAPRSRAGRAVNVAPEAVEKRDLLAVLTALRKGDFSVRLPIHLDGLDGKIADAFNDVVDLSQKFATELERISRAVGKDGRIHERMSIGEVRGAWADEVASLNGLVSDLVQPTSEMARVIGAVAKGDLSQMMAQEIGGRPLKGEFLRTAKTVNTMVEQLASFASEVTRVAREVGTEGKLGGQADVRGVAGTWKDLTDSVNSMAGNLTAQVRNIATVTTAVANGDLSKKITVDVKGEILELKNTINTMVDQLRSFASEVTRVAREVGTEGKLGGQADVKGVAGTWKDLTDSVNSMAGNLTAQVRNIAAVTTAVANGDLSKKITVDVKGEILELKNTINTMVDQLNSFASEVTRVAREVGTEGKLGGQADVRGVAGTWKDLTDSVNSMAGNLTAQVRNIAAVTTAVARGDLSKKITVDVKGEILELKNTINTMVDQLSSFASEVTRVAREVGTEGKLGGQAEVRGVAGVWKDLTDNVNLMGSNLTVQLRDVSKVATAIANGDLTQKITVDARGEILQIKNVTNTMVDQLSSFASEVTRVAREVGTEGKLGGQAEVRGVAGTWKDLTDSVNLMAGNLTAQVRNIAAVTTAVANGDLSKKITVDVRGEILELKNTINTMVDQLNSFASEVTRVAREVGTEGKLGGQAEVKGVAGVWRDLTDSVNFMAGNLTAQVRSIAAVTTAVAKGDLSKKITVDVKGEILELKNTINTMVDQLNSFASEVTRVAREVGTEGKLGGQAEVKGVAGTWKDLTDSVNSMAGNLTNQVRGIARVVTAVANGDLKRKLAVDAKGEIAALADTINGMIETLATFTDQVTTVAREVGVEGKLGGQASVPGAAGTWRDLTDNVNQLAANLTTQVRAIAEVATAVTKGDLTRSITVEAQGEVAALKDNINEMIRNLKDTTQKNAEQDWLKTNLAKFSRMLQGQKDLLTVAKLILSELAPVVSAQQAVFYTLDASREKEEDAVLKLIASYAYMERKNAANEFKLGEGLVGQCALEKQRILLVNPPKDYIAIASGLGEATPQNIIVMPVIFEGQVKAIIELASFERFNPTHLAFLDQLCESIGIVLNTIEANMRTEDLLKQSQSLARELQSQQQELQLTNAQLGDKARLLAEQNAEVERKNREVEQARQALEEKARQLAATSKYKSEFLANMSHELRTPLNSLLILSDQLSKNLEANLTARQVEWAKTIHAAGDDLLSLINDILDLSKIESGTVIVDVGDVLFDDLSDYVERTFRHIAESKKLEFAIEFGRTLPRLMQTDTKRLQQVLKNLLSNAFKFTERGRVTLSASLVTSGWMQEDGPLAKSGAAIAFTVRDTGIGIAAEKQAIIFEAFQQADGSTSRKYGGTGLGLAISREIATMLGGEIRLASKLGEGSTFTLLLPVTYTPPKIVRRREEPATADALLAQPSVMIQAPSSPIEVQPIAAPAFVDDAESIRPGDRVLLVVENDVTFAKLVIEVAREKGFRAILAMRGAVALAMARDRHPAAITLDLNLPEIDGWNVLEKLKRDLTTRHVPVQVITTEEEEDGRALRLGASDVLRKPLKTRGELEETLTRLAEYVRRDERSVLLVDPDDARAASVAELLSGPEVLVKRVAGENEALREMHAGFNPSLLIVDRTLDAEVVDLIERARSGNRPPVPLVLYAPELEAVQEALFERIAKQGAARRVRSLERLFDETSLLLHRPTSRMSEKQRALLDRLYRSNAALKGKKVLVVDDDIRNIFALTTLLEAYEVECLAAETGKSAIETLSSSADVDLVLMDIMMPEMDGYDTIREIRALPQFRALPIFAVTAKAMKGDREKCFEAGATDYLAKPLEPEQLLSLMRLWLLR